MRTVDDLGKDELLKLLDVFAKNWLAHDGCWFLAAEEERDWEHANALNVKGWERFTRVEARRILQFLGREPGGGTEALAEALGFRLYARINEQAIVERDERRLVFRMVNCRVQAARRRKGLPLHRCKAAGLAEYGGFAETIDPRFETTCKVCPPDDLPEGVFCEWAFELRNEES